MDRQPFEGDLELTLAAAQRGEGAAFEALWRWLAPSVTAYFRQHGTREADDLTSETFLRVFRDINRFTGDERGFRSWVFVIAHHRWIDAVRSDARRPSEATSEEWPTSVTGDEASTERLALASVSSDALRSWINELLPDQRDVLLLRLFGDLTIEQIATASDRSAGAVKALQRRGLTHLAKRVGPNVEDFSSEPVPLEHDRAVTLP